MIPECRKANETELEKLRAHNCLITAIYDGQHLVPIKWIFTIKTNGTYKARLVGRGDLVLPWIDFNPKEIYCGNISACGIKLVLTIAASYKLRLRGGYGLKPLIRVATRVRRGCHVKGTERKEEVVYICNRLWLSSDLQHVDNLVVSNQLVFPNK